MKRLHSIARSNILVSLLLGVAACQPQDQQTPEVAVREDPARRPPSLKDSSAGPRAVVREDHHDFGRVFHGQEVVHTYEIENQGDAPLLLQDVRSTCGCAVGRITSRSIPPQGKSRLDVAFDSTNYPGVQNKSVTVITNDPQRASVSLSFRAEVVRVFGLEPALFEFESVAPESTVVRCLEIFTLDESPFQILKATAADPFLEVSWASSSARPGAQTVTATWIPGAPAGWYSKYITLSLDHEIRKELQIPIRGRAASGVTFDPPYRLNFGKVKAGEAAQLSVEILNHDADHVLQVESVDWQVLSKPRVTDPRALLKVLQETVEAGRRYRVLVELSPEIPPHHFRARLEIVTNNSEQPKQNITVQAFVMD
jgi:hypothetical protein